MADVVQDALQRFDAAYGADRDERYYALRQIVLELAASFGYSQSVAAPVVGLVFTNRVW